MTTTSKVHQSKKHIVQQPSVVRTRAVVGEQFAGLFTFRSTVKNTAITYLNLHVDAILSTKKNNQDKCQFLNDIQNAFRFVQQEMNEVSFFNNTEDEQAKIFLNGNPELKGFIETICWHKHARSDTEYTTTAGDYTKGLVTDVTRSGYLC